MRVKCRWSKSTLPQMLRNRLVVFLFSAPQPYRRHRRETTLWSALVRREPGSHSRISPVIRRLGRCLVPANTQRRIADDVRPARPLRLNLVHTGVPLMSKKQPLSIHRRALMSRMAMVGAASLLEPGTSAAQQPSTSRETETPSSTPPSTLPPRTAPSAAAPSAREIAADQQAPAEERLYVGRSGSDRMVDSIKQLDIDYVATMPGSS